ncbi:hypothetical protein [Acinetobacter calcoaceticus]|uniref:hypothetical protein n=1 Tax=Acinetobacter calcoaceticus TaxID=471 RepID=UPI001E5CEF03|nr:hypothetical protein [Acinetobacter calcoaceticus]UGQ26422.1 hypothetical protein LRO55_00535 [Acinetobacter calcoaceticus]
MTINPVEIILENPGISDFFILVLKDGEALKVEILQVDQTQKIIHVSIAGVSTRLISFDQIEMLEPLEEEPYIETIDDQLKRIPMGKYLMVWGHFVTSMNQTCEQGELKSIDWNQRTILLRSRVYEGREDTVYIDKISSIDESREGSGARGPAVAPDWYKGADGKWRKNGREYKG